jgi:hypothetical protein
MQTFRPRLVPVLCSAGQSNAERGNRIPACVIVAKSARRTGQRNFGNQCHRRLADSLFW